MTSMQERRLDVERAFARNPQGKILIAQRALNDRHNPGQWEALGGKVNEGEDNLPALRREFLEETGFVIVVQTSHPKRRWSYVIQDGPYRGFTYTVTFRIAEISGGTIKLSFEHVDFALVTYAQLLTFALTKETRLAAIQLRSSLLF